MTRRTAMLLTLLGSLPALSPCAQAAGAKAALTIPAEVAVSSLQALGDGHLQTMAASLQTLAASSEAKSADWNRIKGPLAETAKLNVPALIWFALPDGSYWDLQEGAAKGNLAQRSYFPKVLKGETVLGDLVISKATGKSVAIVSVPIRSGNQIVGVLGSSIYLDKVSAQIEKQMGLDETMIFYSFDRQPILALEWDAGLIFKNPKELSPEIRKAFEEMMRHDEGTVSYPFRGKERTVVYKKSNITGWWYVFGIVPEGRGKQAGNQ